MFKNFMNADKVFLINSPHYLPSSSSLTPLLLLLPKFINAVFSNPLIPLSAACLCLHTCRVISWNIGRQTTGETSLKETVLPSPVINCFFLKCLINTNMYLCNMEICSKQLYLKNNVISILRESHFGKLIFKHLKISIISA